MLQTRASSGGSSRGLRKNYASWIRSLAADKLDAVVAAQPASWPTGYTNASTGKPYTPHHDAEWAWVQSKTPRYSLLKGGEGCVAAETRIGGIPIADRTVDGEVETLFGPARATAGFLKGRADLYRVRTSGGAEVEVTAEHRFLTPHGWRPLASLSVGDAIAADESKRDWPATETGQDWQGHCCAIFHQGGGLPSLAGQARLSKWPQPRNFGVDSNTTIRWDSIQDIVFVAYGDFYDLTVPDAGHYAAEGLWNHNSGKTTAGAIRTMLRVSHGMDGVVIAPDLPHLRKSTWPELRRWVPWQMVVDRQRYRQAPEWEPNAPFTLTFINGAQLMCGGIDEPGAWEGPNINFAWMDEARRLKTPNALKVLDGRVRIPGRAGEPPQIFITTTPRKNWLFDYFGPLRENDAHEAFKADATCLTLLTSENEINLEPGFVQKRGQSLSETERRVLLEAEWEDIESGERFLENILWWDQCTENLPPLTRQDQMVLALDAGVSSDCFACVGVSRHPDPTRRDHVAVRLVQVWKPVNGKINFDGPEQFIKDTCKALNVKCVSYDPWQLHDMCTRLNRLRVAWFLEFNQGPQRLEADKQLLDMIMQRRLAHDGNQELRQHVDNADRKTDEDATKLRIVKREQGMKVDLAVAMSMAVYQSLKLRLSP